MNKKEEISSQIDVSTDVVIVSKTKGQVQKEVQRDKRLQTKYGITNEHYNAINEAQKSCCKICEKESDNLVVDHCHSTQLVRGLICPNCNLGLGHFKDDAQYLQAAIVYLQQSRYYEVSGIKIPIKEFSKTPTFRIERDDTTN